MKEADQETLEAGRPGITPRAAVSFCLRRLYADRSRRLTDRVVPGLTYEELIGAILLARDVIDVAETE